MAVQAVTEKIKSGKGKDSKKQYNVCKVQYDNPADPVTKW